jgi:hypothetical protein
MSEKTELQELAQAIQLKLQELLSDRFLIPNTDQGKYRVTNAVAVVVNEFEASGRLSFVAPRFAAMSFEPTTLLLQQVNIPLDVAMDDMFDAAKKQPHLKDTILAEFKKVFPELELSNFQMYMYGCIE